jgi:hypothetical protein
LAHTITSAKFGGPDVAAVDVDRRQTRRNPIQTTRGIRTLVGELGPLGAHVRQKGGSYPALLIFGQDNEEIGIQRFGYLAPDILSWRAAGHTAYDSPDQEAISHRVVSVFAAGQSGRCDASRSIT